MIVRINITNEVSNAGYEYFNGEYEISIMPNGESSWINGDYAIWPHSGKWLIGDLENIGINMCWIHAFDEDSGLTDDANIWYYWDGNNWTSPTNQSDIQITCVNK